MEDLSPRETVRGAFRDIFGREPRLFRAPGRVNLIGEHTDYNDGFVLPFAIDRETVVAGLPRSDSKISVHALDIPDAAEFDLATAWKKHERDWINYVEGAARSISKRFPLRRGADLVFCSTVPIGAGLSSSAALEVSIAYALLSLHKIDIDKKALAFAAQEAEHKYVGIRTGIMDQFACVFGRDGHALLLDCRSTGLRPVPLDVKNTALVVCDTKVKHSLASSEYNTRRAECEQGVEILRRDLPEITSLRDVASADLEQYGGRLPEVIRARCRHVITENLRTLDAAEALSSSDLAQVGRLMFESHRSLRDDYEVSCPELDALVEIAGGIDGVYGARMTGGGFGGCTISLIEEGAVEEFSAAIVKGYLTTFAVVPDIYLVKPADGASELT